MNLTIDPDVFRASSFNRNCLLALQKIASEFSIHRFFVDNEEVIIREYQQIFSEKIPHQQLVDEDDVVIRLLQQLLSDSIETITSQHDLVDDFKALGCSEPVEPTLLGMMANAQSRGLVLMLVGEDIDGVRKRGVYDEEKRWKILREIPLCAFIFATSVRIEFDQVNRKVIEGSIQEKAVHFETKAALYLQDIEPSLRCQTPPAKGSIGEEIDVYGYRDEQSNSRTVIIGECKLRCSGNESKLILGDEVKQLHRKVIAARDYENSRKSKQVTPLKFEGILITNASGLDEYAISIIKSQTEFRIRVLRVRLSKNWDMQQHWRIIRSEWLDFNT